MFVDTHAHVYSEYYDDVVDVLKNASDAGITTVISAGVDNKTNQELIDISKKYSNMYICIGIHPEYAELYKSIDLTFIENNINNNKVIAIGEIGLDYHYENYNREKQIDLFEKQLILAEKYRLPVVIHSRDASDDTIKILKKRSVTGVIHSFSGSKETAREYIKLGFKLGINGVVTFKNAHIKDVIKELGIKNFVLETDSPYLTPEPMRGKKNYPHNIRYIVKFLSNYLEISEEEISSITNENVQKIFYKIKI